MIVCGWYNPIASTYLECDGLLVGISELEDLGDLDGEGSWEDTMVSALFYITLGLRTDSPRLDWTYGGSRARTAQFQQTLSFCSLLDNARGCRKFGLGVMSRRLRIDLGY